MATSGTYPYTRTGTQLVTSSLRKCGVIAEGETATAAMLSDGLEALEMMMKGWQADGLHLWKYEEMVLFLVGSQQSYNLGSTGDNFLKKSSLVTTSLSADASSGATTITVDSITGISTTYYIGVVIDNNTIHWTTVNGAPSGTTVTLTTALDGAATDGNAVYVYQTKGPRPLQVTQGRVQMNATNETEMFKAGREDYFMRSGKTSAGTPTEFYYQPSLTNGKLYLYPTVQDERQYLNLTCQVPFEILSSASNNTDFPEEWFLPLVWGLAQQIYPEYGVTDMVTVQKIEKEADKWYGVLSAFDVDDADVVFVPAGQYE